MVKKKEITVDISKHMFIPNHKILNKSEAEIIFKTWKIRKKDNHFAQFQKQEKTIFVTSSGPIFMLNMVFFDGFTQISKIY